MRHKKKGRKIYTYRVKNRRVFSPYHPMLSALGFALTLLVAVVLGFVGYNVIGPILTRTNAEAQNPTQTPDPYFAQDTATTALSAESQTTSAQTTTATATRTETTAPPRPDVQGVEIAYCAAWETVGDLGELQTKAQTLQKQGYTAMVLPLKTRGGALAYASSVKDAATCGATSAEQPALEEIFAAITAQGLSCFASMDTLGDNLFAGAFIDGAYQLRDGGRWHDMAVEDGGKPWISPFSQHARDYLSEISREISQAGAAKVFCTGLEYPKFYETDLDYIGGQVKDPQSRKEGLCGTVNAMAQNTPGLCPVFELSEILTSQEEGFDMAALQVEQVCIRISPRDVANPFFFQNERYDLSGQDARAAFGTLLEIAGKCGGEGRVIPCIVRAGLSDEQLSAVLENAQMLGFRTILVSES